MDSRSFIIFLLCLACFDCRAPTIDYKPYCKHTCKIGKDKHISTPCAYKCARASRCKEFQSWPLTKEEREFMRDRHNELRQNVASGNDTRGENGAAADMMVMNYAIELEIPAICWGLQCKWGHDLCRKTPEFPMDVGQNLYKSTNEKPFKKMDRRDLEWSMNGWYKEIVDFSKDRIIKYHDRFPKAKKKIQIGHYAQLVWAKTTHVGCARVTYLEGKNTILYILCDYAPSGNYVTLPVYQLGTPASKCPKGTKANKKYPALCGEIKPIPAKKLYPDGIGAATRTTMSTYLLMLLITVACLIQFL